MAAVEFRQALIADLPAIIELLADDDLGRQREDSPNYEAAFRAIAKDANQLLAVAERDGEVVGCLQLTFIPGLSRVGAWRGQLESVRVSSKLRGGGLGRLLFEWAGDRGMPTTRMRAGSVNDRQVSPGCAQVLPVFRFHRVPRGDEARPDVTSRSSVPRKPRGRQPLRAGPHSGARTFT
jgi:hypothetical protein